MNNNSIIINELLNTSKESAVIDCAFDMTVCFQTVVTNVAGLSAVVELYASCDFSDPTNWTKLDSLDIVVSTNASHIVNLERTGWKFMKCNINLSAGSGNFLVTVNKKGGF